LGADAVLDESVVDVVLVLELSEAAAGLAIAPGASAAKAGAERAVANRAADRIDRVRFITRISLSWAVRLVGRGVKVAVLRYPCHGFIGRKCSDIEDIRFGQSIKMT
jgi:hypothetical protein